MVSAYFIFTFHKLAFAASNCYLNEFCIPSM